IRPSIETELLPFFLRIDERQRIEARDDSVTLALLREDVVEEGEAHVVLRAFEADEAGERIFGAVGGGSGRRRAFTSIRDLQCLHAVAAIARRRIADTARRGGDPVEEVRIAGNAHDAGGEGRTAEPFFHEE